MSRPIRPIVKLRPKRGRRLAEGAPWAFADEIAMDRRTRNLAPGSLVTLADGDRALGTAAFNPGSTIAARLLDPDPAAEIDRAWLADRLHRALGLRARLYATPHYRLVHAEGDGLPGVVVDRFGDALVLQPNAAWAEVLVKPLSEALMQATSVGALVINATSRTRKLEGLDEYLKVAHGTADRPVEVPMNGATYLADLTGGQKTGLYYDQRENHAFAQRLAGDARVLDVFCHVGGFALAALAAGAASAIGIDSSATALAFAEEGAQRTGVAERFATRKADAFDALKAFGESGEAFDLVICDPPAFAPNKGALANGLRAYRRLARLAAAVVAPGGWLALCSCSHAADPQSFHQANVRGMAQAGRSAALVHSGRAGPDHPSHVALPETSYLKAMFYRLDG